jgi:putative ABC transport system permease protein
VSNLPGSCCLLVRSIQRLNAVHLGFEPIELVTAEISRAGMGEPGGSGSASTHDLSANDLAGRLRQHPAVREIALASNAPFGSHASMSISVPGRVWPDISPRDGPWFSSVSPNYFRVMGTRLVSGRLFTAGDVHGSAPVVIVNQTMARLVWQGESPFRSCILLYGSCPKVIGVVEDIRDSHDVAPPPRYYLPLAQRD